MIRTPLWLLPAVCLSLFLSTPASAQTLSFGNVSVDQNNPDNTAAAVTLSLDYSHGTISIRPNGSNRGDFGLNFSAQPNQDRANGILITTASQNGRDNSHAGDNPAVRYSTTADYNSGGSWAVSTINTSGGEWNTDFAAAWFPYAEGWIGGHAVASGGALSGSSSALSPGLTVSTSALGPNVIYDSPDAATPGVYEINLAGINSMVDGILLTVGGDNTDNYSLARANADGTWTVTVADNGTNGNSGENTAFGFVYVPKSKLVTSPDQAGIHAMGRVNGNMTRDVTAGNYVLVRSGLGTYKLYAPGIDPEMATLLLGMELGTGDNILTYGSIAHGWEIANRDLPSAGLQDAGSGDLLSFTIMAGGNTAAVWDAGGGANSNWSTGNNWVGDGLPTAGKDVILGIGGASVQIDSAQTAGMVFINRDTAFTLSGTAPLTVNTGIILNSAPTSAQTHTISAPIILGDHAIVISQSTTSSANILKFDVASGNAITADGFDLTLSGGGTIDFRDAISLGTGKIIKEGDGQVDLYAANFVGGTVITSGPTGTTSGAFRLNAAAAYDAFGTGAIELRTDRPDGEVLPTSLATTALYFDAGAGSGELLNDIVFQSAVANTNVRFLVDASASMNVTLSGLISGGNATSRFVLSSDAANGQGRFHFTNTANTFIA
ncbi:MAG TPA: hypothetical protein VLE43_20450 [Candidatus Saccharimonadia bacterium]|nr:hypothetical protein [Candidatus Saccharimonadia bacterium]